MIKIEDYCRVNAHEYDILRSGHMEEKRYVAVMKIICSLLTNKKINKVYEFGCGTGSLSYKLARKFNRIKFEASDINKGFIEYAAEKYKRPNLSFIVLDIEKNSPKKTADLIITVDMLHHLGNLENSLRNIANAVRDGGFWIAIEHNIFNPYIFINQTIMHNEKRFNQFLAESLIRKYFKIIRKNYFTLIPSWIKKPPAWLKRLELLLENNMFIGGSVIYLFKKTGV